MSIYHWVGCAVVTAGIAAAYWLPPPQPISSTPFTAGQGPSETPQVPVLKADPTRVFPQQPDPTSAQQDPAFAQSELWPEAEWTSTHNEEGVTLHQTRADTRQLAGLGKGSLMTLPLPDRPYPVRARVVNEKKGFNDMPVFSGVMEDNPDSLEGVTVVRGKLDTHVTVVTRQATWNAVVNNETGETTLVDERERMKHQFLDHNDGVETDHPPLPEPPTTY